LFCFFFFIGFTNCRHFLPKASRQIVRTAKATPKQREAGGPDHDTITRIKARLEPEEFNQCFIN
jgi:hypothetical protein